MSSAEIQPRGPENRVILVGNPNVGKSVVFGYLTGRYVTVSNYPGTTVEVSRGEARERGKSVEVVDTPGVYSLLPMSEDERVTRDILMREPGAKVLQVCDAKNMRRSLMITVQLAEMGVPLVLAVNMADEARSRGVMPKLEGLEDRIGVPAVPTVAVRKKGMDRLMTLLEGSFSSPLRISYGEKIEAALTQMEWLLPEATPIGKRAIAMMLLCGDDSLSPWLAEHVPPDRIRTMNAVRNRLVEENRGEISYRVNQIRLAWIDALLAGLGEEKGNARRTDWGERFGRWAMDPLYGIPILAGVLFLAYGFVGVFGAGFLVDFLEETLFGKWLVPAVERAAGRVIPWEILRDFLVGPYGMISMALSYAIAIVLPIVGTFFLGFGILEDSGYLPRLAVMVDRIFKKIGCNGKAVLPMILGLGCDTMATLTTRILETRKERIIVTLLLALGIPCSAQLGVILGMLSDVGPAATVAWGAILVGVILLVGFLASKVIPGESSDFILEIPPIRMPQFSNLGIKTMARIEWYLREAVPLFLLGTFILFVGDRMGWLVRLQAMAEPVVVGMLDLPPKTAEAFLIGFLRRDYGAAGLFDMARAGMLTNLQVVVSLVTITLFIPCLANFLVIIKEHGGKVAAGMGLFIFPFAILVGAAVNLAARRLGISF
ncbi:MAG TPA: ferrous iron transport protein B [Deltaproteobacteria bacterium]|nr:MAG: ferrous iron transport protein B [Deltaproteobacteria bacterium GWC2_65_14]HBO70109.1 ferrous iron transport protein B [Deltaproteobacteria bacterium]